jgi:hypothetical protein
MRNVHSSRTAHERELAARRRIRRQLDRPPATTVNERWQDGEAVNAAIELAEYFRSESYGHACAVAAALEHAS